MLDLELLQKLNSLGYYRFCGVDEAGRGPLAGPVTAAAVVLPENYINEKINDSKKLTDKRRRELFLEIKQVAIAYKIVFVDAVTIDKINILQATLKAMVEAVGAIDKNLFDIALIDGNAVPAPIKSISRAVISGDKRHATIAAASILAKVARDDYMVDLHEKFPQYDFAKHKGYGTKAHINAILEHGICPEHRKSFLTKILNK